MAEVQLRSSSIFITLLKFATIVLLLPGLSATASGCLSLQDPSGEALLRIEEPVPVDTMAMGSGDYNDCSIVRQIHVVHFPFVLPLNSPSYEGIKSDPDSILIKYRSMRWSDVGYTALGFLLGVITDTEVLASCTAQAGSDRLNSVGEMMQANGPRFFSFYFESGATKPDAPEEFKALKAEITKASSIRAIVTASADCAGEADENAKIVQLRGNWARSALVEAGLEPENIDILLMDRKACDGPSQGRQDQRYVFVILTEAK